LLVALAYCSAGRNNFINFDDSDYVTENEYVRDGLTLHNIYVVFAQPHAANWHPLTWISHMVDCQVFKMQPAGHHLISVAIHAANSVLLFLVLLRMTRAAWPSAAVAALFAVHPLHVESVAWVAERKDVLSTLFGLAALWAWTSYVARPGVLRYLAVAVCYAASLMSKPMLVTLPFLLLLLDWWPFNRLKDWHFHRRPTSILLLEKMPLALMSLASCLKTLDAQAKGHAVVPLGRLSIAARLDTIAEAYCGYLKMLFVPTRLAPIYPLPRAPNYTAAIVCMNLLAVVTILLLLASPRRKYLAVGWLWYLGTLVPVIGLVHVGQQSMADRYTYFPAVGIFILVLWTTADAIARWRWLQPPLAALAAAAVAGCCVLCNFQVRLWASTKTLFEHTVAVTKDNPVALTNLGLVAINEDRLADAQRYLDEALRLDPSEIDAWGNVANLYRKQKKYDDALNAYRTIDRLCPGNPKCLNLMASIFELQGKHAEAETCLRKALVAEPASILYLGTLAQILQTDGKNAEALKTYLEIVDRLPNESHARNNAAWILATCSDARIRNGAKAIELLLPAAQGSDRDSNLLDTLAAAYAESGQFDRAVETVQQAIRNAHDESVPAGAIADMNKRLDLYKNGHPYHDK
jgi:tetratricopeptide (TPR) repeat protein